MDYKADLFLEVKNKYLQIFFKLVLNVFFVSFKFRDRCVCRQITLFC